MKLFRTMKHKRSRHDADNNVMSFTLINNRILSADCVTVFYMENEIRVPSSISRRYSFIAFALIPLKKGMNPTCSSYEL